MEDLNSINKRPHKVTLLGRSGLHVNRLTLDKGEVDVEGKIDSFTYSEQASMTAKSESLLTRLFK